MLNIHMLDKVMKTISIVRAKPVGYGANKARQKVCAIVWIRLNKLTKEETVDKPELQYQQGRSDRPKVEHQLGTADTPAPGIQKVDMKVAH